MAISTMIGAKIQRREDPRLITGNGRYVEDLLRPGTLSMSAVRSPHPHARITRINVTHARPELPGFYQRPLQLAPEAWQTAIDSQARAFLTDAQACAERKEAAAEAE